MCIHKVYIRDIHPFNPRGVKNLEPNQTINKNRKREKRKTIQQKQYNKNKKTIKMDIFDNAILCKKCNKVMKPVLISRNGFNLRAIKCEKCNETIIHPVDKQEYENFMRLKQKEFNVKMRMVGNSYAVSIPRQIVDFMREQEKMMNDMVRLSFEDAGRLSLAFNTPENQEAQEAEHNQIKSRMVSAKEIRVVRNGKPVLHVRKVQDSAHPERNQTKVFKTSSKLNSEDEELD